MPSSSPIQYSGFETHRTLATDLEEVIGASYLEHTQSELRRFESENEDDYDPARWNGLSRELVPEWIESSLERGMSTDWRDWRITTAEGIVYASTTRVTAEAPDLDHFEGALELSMRITAGRYYLDDEQGVELRVLNGYATAIVTAPEGAIRSLSDQVRAVLERYVVQKAPDPLYLRPFKVFIAYGGGRMWEVVRDYLQGAGVEVDAFTQSERASQQTIDVVSGMIHSASMAVIVMTAADQVGGEWQARQNVIHELGFAQGVLGLQRTLLLKEDGVSLPSNLDGVTYISFARGEIHTTRERVVNIIKAARADYEAGIG